MTMTDRREDDDLITLAGDDENLRHTISKILWGRDNEFGTRFKPMELAGLAILLLRLSSTPRVPQSGGEEETDMDTEPPPPNWQRTSSRAPEEDENSDDCPRCGLDMVVYGGSGHRCPTGDDLWAPRPDEYELREIERVWQYRRDHAARVVLDENLRTVANEILGLIAVVRSQRSTIVTLTQSPLDAGTSAPSVPNASSPPSEARSSEGGDEDEPKINDLSCTLSKMIELERSLESARQDTERVRQALAGLVKWGYRAAGPTAKWPTYEVCQSCNVARGGGHRKLCDVGVAEDALGKSQAARSSTAGETRDDNR
jgi:hypothetical protein